MTQETESEGDTWRPGVNHAVTDNLTTNTSTFCPAVTYTATCTRNTPTDCTVQTAASNIATVQTATNKIATTETAANSDALTQGVQSAVTGQSKSAFVIFL